jgi:long-chain acyl-CoA synthetase
MIAPRQPSIPSSEARIAAALQALPGELARGMSLALWAKVTPDSLAVLAVDGERTFHALNARCNQLARGLRARGLSAGDSVALMCSNRSEFAEVFWAARRAGLRLTPVNWHLTGEEAAYIVDDCDAKAFFVEARFDRAAAVIRSRAGKLISSVAIGGSLTGFLDYEAVLSGQSECDLDDPQLGTQMLYTSGTTGRPKGVHRPQQTALLSAALTLANYTPSASVHLATGPLYHAAPLAFSLLIPHACGAAVLMMDSWDAERALQLIERYRVTHTHMVPTMFQRLLSLPEATRSRYDVSSLTYVLHGAAPCPAAVKRAVIDWFGPIVYEYYAATEGTAAYVDSPTWLSKPGTVGQVSPADQVKILDESGRELPRNQRGLIFLKVPEGAGFHYYKDDEKTRRAYRGDYFTLEDVGYLDDDDYLFLTDRSADLIISGGVNIYPAEVEAVLLTHPAVADAAVIGVPSAAWGEEVKAAVALREGHPPAQQLGAALIEHCRARLAHFKCPRSVDFVDDLPRDDSGKLSRHRLRDVYRRTAPVHQS